MSWVRSSLFFVNVLFSIGLCLHSFNFATVTPFSNITGATLSKQWGLFKVYRTQSNMDIHEPLFIQNPSRRPDSRLKSWNGKSENDLADLWQLLTFISAFIFQTQIAAAIMCSPSYQYWNQLISCAACCACWKTNDEKDFFRDLRQASGNVLLSGLVGTYWVQSQTQILPSSYHMCIASYLNSIFLSVPRKDYID